MHNLNDTDQPTTNHFHTVCNEHAYITIYVYERLNEVSVKCVQVIGRGYCLFNYSLGQNFKLLKYVSHLYVCIRSLIEVKVYHASLFNMTKCIQLD